jgi:hypothetical protein
MRLKRLARLGNLSNPSPVAEQVPNPSTESAPPPRASAAAISRLNIIKPSESNVAGPSKPLARSPPKPLGALGKRPTAAYSPSPKDESRGPRIVSTPQTSRPNVPYDLWETQQVSEVFSVTLDVGDLVWAELIQKA